MSEQSVGFNQGQYDLSQQAFCLSMLTCLSFNLTGRSAAGITQKYRRAVENVLHNEAAQSLIGSWELVWGPVVYADAFVGAKASVNSMFIATPKGHPEQAVLAIAGTNGISLMGWMVEDLNVKETVAWPYGETTLKPHLTKGAAYGFSKLLELAEAPKGGGTPQTARDYFAAHPNITQILVTGHSLGGCLAPVYTLYLENTRTEWDTTGIAKLSCLATAGQTPGDTDFSKLYDEKLAAVTQRVWNQLDIVPHAFQPDTLRQIPAMYVPQIAVQPRIQKLIDDLGRETANNHYVNVMPEAPAFASKFMRLEEIAGEKYKPFIDFIDNMVKTVRRANLFGVKDITGAIDFVVHALIQHIFPYFSHFGIDAFIKIMCAPPKSARVRQARAESEKKDRSLWAYLQSLWTRMWARIKNNDTK